MSPDRMARRGTFFETGNTVSPLPAAAKKGIVFSEGMAVEWERNGGGCMDISPGLRELRERLLQYLPEDGMKDTGLPGVSVARHSFINEPERCLYGPVIALLVGGRKHSAAGVEECDCGPGDCLVMGMDLPVLCYVSEASPEDPCLGVALRLDGQMLAELAAGTDRGSDRQDASRAVSMIHADEALIDAFLRMVRLLEFPRGAPFLAPLIVREIHYRALLSSAGWQLAQLCAEGSPSRQVVKAAAWLRENFRRPMKMEELARYVGMGVSTLHHHFRSVTAMSPLQYQKRLRLMEARRLMLVEHCDAVSAGLSVGYESVSQFSREYRRLFGLPPGRDAAQRRQQDESTQIS